MYIYTDGTLLRYLSIQLAAVIRHATGGIVNAISSDALIPSGLNATLCQVSVVTKATRSYSTLQVLVCCFAMTSGKEGWWFGNKEGAERV